MSDAGNDIAAGCVVMTLAILIRLASIGVGVWFIVWCLRQLGALPQ